MGEPFRLLGGHLALDFVNTVGGRTHTSASRYTVERERVTTIADLYEWASLAGIAMPAVRAHSRAANAVLARARRLREALYMIFRGQRRDLDVLNEELAIARRHERLAIVSGEPKVVWDDPAALDRPLWEVARAAASLLTSDQLDRVRQCGGESCGWLFLDTSRNRSRQWCDMADCGNLAKVRRFRERKQSAR